MPVSRDGAPSDADQWHFRSCRATTQWPLPCPVHRPGRAALQGTDSVPHEVGRTRLAGAATLGDHPQGVGAARGHAEGHQGYVRGLRQAVDGAPRTEGPHPRALPDTAGSAPGARVRRRCRWHPSPATMCGPGTPSSAPRLRPLRSHAYGLLRTILGTAASDGKISLNPCVIRGAGSTKRVHKIRPASLPELETITQAMPEQYRP